MPNDGDAGVHALPPGWNLLNRVVEIKPEMR
jgi:hypothetical protein